jgi:acyl-CoA thioesterase FadM
VLDHLRGSGFTPRELYEEHGLSVEIVDSDARILHALHMDDVVRTEVVRQPPGASADMVMRATSYVDRSPEVKAVTATVRVQFRRIASTVDGDDVPTELLPHSVVHIDRSTESDDGLVNGRGLVGSAADVVALPGHHGAPDGPNAIVWRWRIPYFYCHFSERLQHSGYLRIMEEVVDLFLAERGISIRTMLESRRWIPVVPRARVEILREAYLEEELYTVLTIEEVFKDLTYTARMDCYVSRSGRLVKTATGTITHGYAVVLDRRNWRLVPFDPQTVAALRGNGIGPLGQAREGRLSWSA